MVGLVGALDPPYGRPFIIKRQGLPRPFFHCLQYDLVQQF